MPTVGYTSTEELGRVLKINSPSPAQSDVMEEVLNAALWEVDDEIGLHEDDAVVLSGDGPLALAAEVQLERAVEHWHARPISFGILGLDTEAPIRLARDTWDRHAFKLAPLKESWGLA